MALRTERDAGILAGELLENGVALPSPGDVEGYFKLHPQMPALAARVSELARREFGNSAALSLELFRDRESDDQHLVLYIRQVDYDGQIMDRLDKISREFEADLEQTDGWLLVTTDFAPPQ